MKVKELLSQLADTVTPGTAAGDMVRAEMREVDAVRDAATRGDPFALDAALKDLHDANGKLDKLAKERAAHTPNPDDKRGIFI